MEAVLLHELVHIRRNDYLVNLFVATAEILFFFNPFVKQLVTAIRKEREYSCDDMVLQFRYQPRQYAAALLNLEKERTAAVTFGIAASGRGQKQLLVRVQRIMGIKTNRQQLPRAGAYLLVAVLLGFIAMVNPVKMVADKISPMVVRFTSHSILTHSNKEQDYTIVNYHAQKAVHKQGLKKNSEAVSAQPGDDNDQPDLEPASNQDGGDQSPMHEAVIVESRDFSLPESNAAQAPAPDENTATDATPYVPNNSFSYHFVPDTSIPRIKGETFSEKQAREALAKAKIALEQIDWRRIEHDLRYNKRAIEKLKAEISKEIAGLNWQQINQQVQDQQKLAEIQKARAVYLKEQTLKQYQQSETYNEAMRKQLMENDQLLKDNEKRAADQQKALLDQQKKQEADMKKKRIVYI
jgi:hypothetical protein